jgi:hypothetical protein
MKVRSGRNSNFFQVISLSANVVADGVNDLAKYKNCQLKENLIYGN